MHPEIVSIALFWFVTAYTPGPNNVVASYSGFNFGIIKTIPHILGVTLGFTSLVIFLTIGLINVFKLFPIIQVVMKYLGTLFLIYLAYKIATATTLDETKKENPVKFIETFFFSIFKSKSSYCINYNGIYLCRKRRKFFKLFYMGNWYCFCFCMF